MALKLFVATRKGLFTLGKTGGRWSVENTAFLGDNVTNVCVDPRSVNVSPWSSVSQTPPQEIPTRIRRESRGCTQIEWRPGAS